MEVLQLKDNVIPKGLIPLEELFDQDDVARNPSLVPTEKDLKVYNKDIIQHTISIKPNQKPFRQKLKRINPKLLPSIEKESNISACMDIAIANKKDIFLVVYLDDLTMFSGSDDEHIHHLRIVFQRCRKFGVSLNPKKSLFAMEEGKLLGHIISKEGIHIDPSRVEAIQ
eukprot:PITA_36414